MSDPKLVVCYSLGTGAGFDLQLASMSRQICEDLAEILALYEDFITVAQMIVVREDDEIAYETGKNACAFAVFYSLPETRWVIDSTRAIGGDMALTGRIVDDESGLLVSVNLIDSKKNILLFCGCETCTREKIHEAICRLGARILSHFTPQSADDWLPKVCAMFGTQSFAAYANWMATREAERRAQREGLSMPYDRMAQSLTQALSADPHYERAAMRLCDILPHQLQKQTYEFILRYLDKFSTETEALALIVVQALARLAKRTDAERTLDDAIKRYPQNGVFYLMRSSIRTNPRAISRDVDDAKRLLGNAFFACKNVVDNALVNVTGV